jgi:hypothetical protein
MHVLLLALLLAQPSPPCPACNEDPEDVAARVLYERALRAEYDGRAGEAVREAQECVAKRPSGRFADAARELIARSGSAARPRSGAIGPRTELVIDSTLAGAYLSGLLIGATSPDTKGGVAMEMIGTGGALAASILLTSGKHVPDGMPQMLMNGLGYGTYVALISLAIENGSYSNGTFVGRLLGGASAGAAIGLISSVYIPGGDAAAISSGMVWGGAIPVMIEGALGPRNGSNAPLWTALIGSTAGMIAAPIFNQTVNYSRGRWNLISLGGGVGALMGAGVGVLADALPTDTQGGLALMAAGSVAGLGLMALLTRDFDGDERSALNISITPTRFLDRTAPLLQVAGGRF